MSEPVAIATWSFGGPAVEESYRRLLNGASSLDAVEAGINVTELDPDVTVVGYGGLPNSEGVVELDAAIMDGPGHRAGSVAALQDICTPISVARKVMERSPHVMLVGQGARQFALEHGFKPEPTVTGRSRELYDQWVASGKPERWLGGEGKAIRSTGTEVRADNPDVPPTGMPGATAAPSGTGDLPDGHDTIGLAALDNQGRLAVGCSTSGIAFKAPGRVGDSPIIGAGLYVDQAVGAATATGVGELILRFCLSHFIVEAMSRGVSPQQACEQAILRVVKEDPRFGTLQIGVIALRADGEYGAASARPPQNPLCYAVSLNGSVQILDAVIPL